MTKSDFFAFFSMSKIVSGFFDHVHIMLLGLVEKMKDTMRYRNTMQYGKNQMVNVNEIDYDL